MTPKVTTVRQDDSHRLIPSRYSDESVLERLAEDADQLDDLFELDGATNDRLLGEANLLPGISVHELLFGVPYAHIVNAAFTHPHPAGSRFNGPERGAWYAAFELETAGIEVAYHKMIDTATSEVPQRPGMIGKRPALMRLILWPSSQLNDSDIEAARRHHPWPESWEKSRTRNLISCDVQRRLREPISTRAPPHSLGSGGLQHPTNKNSRAGQLEMSGLKNGRTASPIP